MTDKELRDAAVAALKQTTVGYKNKHWTTPPEGSQWDKALDLLVQIGVEPPTPPSPPDPDWRHVASEWQAFTLGERSEVRYGAGTRWNTKTLEPGTYECSNSFFGDPALGVSKSCQARPTSAPPPPPTGNEPPAIAGKGYAVTFADDFSTFDYGPQNKWSNGIWYGQHPMSDTSRVNVQNGILRVIAKRDSGQPWSFTTTLWNQGRGGRSFRYGYFEARMKWDNIVGAWPSFWVLSTADRYGENSPSLLCSEIDFFEGYIMPGYGPRAFTGTLHKNTSSPFGIPDETRGINPVQVADMTTGFHTYGCLWTATEVSWYFDNTKLTTVAPYDSTNQDMFLLFGMQVTSQIGGPPLAAPEAKLEVDWVKVWQK